MNIKAMLAATVALGFGAALPLTEVQASIIATIDAGQLPDPAGPQFDGQTNIIVNNVSNVAFGDLHFNGFGNGYDIGGLGAHQSKTVGIVLYDYDSDFGFTISATIGNQTFTSQAITPSSNLTGGFVDYGGTLHDANFTPVTVGNIQADVGGVPEPASWALMILGLGGVGAAMRHKTRSLTAAA